MEIACKDDTTAAIAEFLKMDAHDLLTSWKRMMWQTLQMAPEERAVLDDIDESSRLSEVAEVIDVDVKLVTDFFAEIIHSCTVGDTTDLVNEMEKLMKHSNRDEEGYLDVDDFFFENVECERHFAAWLRWHILQLAKFREENTAVADATKSKKRARYHAP